MAFQLDPSKRKFKKPSSPKKSPTISKKGTFLTSETDPHIEWISFLSGISEEDKNKQGSISAALWQSSRGRLDSNQRPYVPNVVRHRARYYPKKSGTNIKKHIENKICEIERSKISHLGAFYFPEYFTKSIPTPFGSYRKMPDPQGSSRHLNPYLHILPFDFFIPLSTSSTSMVR